MKLPNFYGAFVHSRRRALKLSQRDLSHRADVSRGLVAHIEQGRVDPKIGVFVRLCAALDVPVAAALTTIDHARERYVLAKRIADKARRAA